jgi:drug/metabolite transporter (DMT)-like permease
MEETNRNRSGNYSLDLAFLIASGLMFGTFPIFATLLTGTGVNALEQATWRFLLALPMFFFIGIALEKTTLFIIDRSDAILFLSQGVVLFLAAITFIEAISLGLEANLTGFLGNISPIFVIVLQRALFKEKISWKKALPLC